MITYQNILTLLSHYCFFCFLLFFLFVGELSLRCFTCQSFFNSIVYAKCYRVKVKSSFLFPFVSQEGGGRIHQSIKKNHPPRSCGLYILILLLTDYLNGYIGRRTLILFTFSNCNFTRYTVFKFRS